MNNRWAIRWAKTAVWLAAALALACDSVDSGTGTTADHDYTITLEVKDRFIHVGDQIPLTVRLKRTDNSNLPKNLRGGMVFTTTVHGQVELQRVDLAVGDDTTAEWVRVLVFTAQRPGFAQVRATFLGATAQVEVQISRLNP